MISDDVLNELRAEFPGFEAMRDGENGVLLVSGTFQRKARICTFDADGVMVWNNEPFWIECRFASAVDAAENGLGMPRASRTLAALDGKIQAMAAEMAALKEQVADLQGWVSSIRAQMPGAP